MKSKRIKKYISMLQIVPPTHKIKSSIIWPKIPLEHKDLAFSKKQKYWKFTSLSNCSKIKKKSAPYLRNQLLLNCCCCCIKNYLCDRLKTPKMASGHYWKVQKFATEIWNWKQNRKKSKKQKLSIRKIMSEWIFWVNDKECVSVRKTEPVINFCHQEYTW